MNRTRVLQGLGTSLLLAGCAGGGTPLSSVTKLPQANQGKTVVNLRRSVKVGESFPRIQPTGFAPAKHFSEYKPLHRNGANTSRSTRFEPVCGVDGCPTGGGGGYGGPPPDSSTSSGRFTSYTWSSSNYVELWDNSDGTLQGQFTTSSDSAASEFTGSYASADGTTTTVTVPWGGLPSEGYWTTPNGAIHGYISQNAGYSSATNTSTGQTMAGTINIGAGTTTLSGQTGGGTPQNGPTVDTSRFTRDCIQHAVRDLGIVLAVSVGTVIAAASCGAAAVTPAFAICVLGAGMVVTGAGLLTTWAIEDYHAHCSG